MLSRGRNIENMRISYLEMILSVEEGDVRFLDIKLYHDSFGLKQVILLLLKLITKDQGHLKKGEEFTQQVLTLERQVALFSIC